MKLIIDIDEETYIKANAGILGSLGEIIANGTPLPKGHGRMKDIDKVEQLLDLDKPDNAIAKALKNIMESVPTILEADNGEV